MKFIHMADMHLGAEPDKGFPWSAERAEQIWETFREIIERCRTEKPDLLLIAGDLFHKQPLVRELKEVDALFASIPEVRVVIIAGNHDYISGISNYNGFEWSPNVIFFKTEELQSVYFEDIDTRVWGLSFCHRQIHEPLLDGAEADASAGVNILLMHGGENSNLPVDRKKLLSSGFDYIACGHFHTPTTVEERMIYPGCPEPLEKNDIGRRGYIIGDIGNDGGAKTLTTEYVTCNKVSYFKEEIEVTGDTTQFMLEDEIRERIAEDGGNNIFTFRIVGRRDPDIVFDTGRAERIGRITEVRDESEPDYDFERLEADNRDNIIGQFIKSIRKAQIDDETAEKALNYGISALLGQDRK